MYEHRSTVSLRVYAIADLAEKVVPFLRSFPLRSEKRVEFELWARAINLVWQYCARLGGMPHEDEKGFAHKTGRRRSQRNSRTSRFSWLP